MSLLFRHLRVHHVFGANTDVGKTVLTTALVRAAARNSPVYYLKPVSTGDPSDADTAHLLRYAASHRVSTHCLYQYDHPVSPHLAVQLSNRTPISDHTLVNAIATYVRRTAHNTTQHAHLFVETAGGVHSPTLSGTTQVDAYRPLFLPTILIGDANLGGISTTISAYEALLLRGYIVDAVLLFKDQYYKNSEYLKQYFAERGIWVADFEKPPERQSAEQEDRKQTEMYYQKIVGSPTVQGEHNVLDVLQRLNEAHINRLEQLDSMPGRTLKSVWWPFVQHAHFTSEKDVNVIDSAHGDFFSIYTKPDTSSTNSLLSPQLDASASWWTQTFGHADTKVTLAAARAAGRYGHVMFPGATHLPALRLIEALLEGPGKGWAQRVFISDNGSTGMEVGIKMALRAYMKRMHSGHKEKKERLGVLGLTGSYHGDTIGAMDMCEPGVYTCEWHDAKGVWLEPPTVAFRQGRLGVQVPDSVSPAVEIEEFDDVQALYDVDARMHTKLAKLYKDHVESVLRRLEQERLKKKEIGEETLRFAALVLEPLVMGAGGMRFVDPLFQRVLVDVVRSADPELGLCGILPAAASQEQDWQGLPVIFDEVFVGLYRLGLQRTSDLLGASPDIAVNAKVLTGGLVPLATTMAREGIFKAFWGEGKESALLHGHSYTAHAVGCEVACETLEEIGKLAKGLSEGGEGWLAAKEVWGALTSYSEGQEGREAEAEAEVREEDGKKVWSFWDPEFVKKLSEAEKVEEVMTLGCVLAIKVVDKEGGYTSHAAQNLLSPLKDLHLQTHAEGSHVLATQAPGGAPFSVHYRTLGNVAYFMTSLNTRSDAVREIEDRIWEVLG